MTVTDVTRELSRTALRALATRGPLDDEPLAGLLGLDPDGAEYDELLMELLDHDRVIELSDGRMADAVALLLGVTLTHRLAETEAASGRLETAPDFAPLSELADDGVPLARGDRVRITVDSLPSGEYVERIAGPDGWLADARAGDLVGLELTEQGLVVHAPVLAPTEAAARVTADAFANVATECLEIIADHGDASIPSMELTTVLWELLAAGRHSPPVVLPPLAELCERARLPRAGVFVGRDEPPAGSNDLAEAVVRVEHRLTDDELEGFRALRRLHRSGLQLSPRDRELAAGAMASAEVTAAFLEHTRADAATADLAREVAAWTTGPAKAGALWLLSRSSELSGDTRAAEAALRAAVDADPENYEVLLDLAWYAEDRGEAERALAYLRRAGVPDDDEDVHRLLSLLARPSAAGRNDQCPCGSGRKFKRCCADRPGGDPTRRAYWLVDKVLAFALRPGQVPDLERVARILAGPEPDEGASKLAYPLAFDLAVFDEGILDRFLAQRGPLLPPDERRVAASWAGSRRAVYDITSWRRGRMSLQPRGGQAPVTVRVPESAGEGQPTGPVVARVLDGFDGPLLFHPPTPLDPTRPDLEAVVEAGDPSAIAAACAPGSGLANAEGEPSVLCTTRYEVTDEAAAVAALRRLGLREDAPGSFTDWVTVRGKAWVSGWAVVVDGVLRLDTNGERRMGDLRARVEAALPDADVLVDARIPVRTAFDDYERFAIPAERFEPPAEARAALADYLRQAERDWCDESIPALGGLTPRDALADPERRGDLVRLLDDFDTLPAGEGGFSAERLRVLLGL